MNDSLPQLPDYDPHPDLWARIEADLGHNEKSATESLRDVVKELPIYEPKADLWVAIESELDPIRVRPLCDKPRIRWIWAGIAAAAVVVLIGNWLFPRPKAIETIRIEYAVEQAGKPNVTSDYQSPADKRAEEFIIRQCADQQLVCQRPDVHELRNQLTELTTAQQRISRERQVFGDDPMLIRAQVKIRNQRAEVMKELITILRS